MASPSETARVVLDLALSHPPTLGEARLVCVDGPAGSGKTSLATAVAALVDGARLLHLDDLYAGWSGLDHGVAQLQGVLSALAEGRAGHYRRYDWWREEFAETRTVEPGPVVVVDGVGSGALASLRLCTVLVWVEAPAAVRVSRGLERDGSGVAEHWPGWEAAEQALFESQSTKARADVVVDGTGALPPRLRSPKAD